MSNLITNDKNGVYFSNKKTFAKAVLSIMAEVIPDANNPVPSKTKLTATSTASGTTNYDAIINAINSAIHTLPFDLCNSNNNDKVDYSKRILIIFNYQNEKDLNINKAFFKFLIDKNIFVDVDYYAYPQQTTTNQEITKIYKRFYKKGYRFAIGFETSDIIVSIMLPFLEKHSDFMFFNLFATNDIYLTIPNYTPPQNIIITNVSYSFMINYILKTFLTDIVNILSTTNNTKFINNIFNSNLKTDAQPYYFQKIAYIYTNTLGGKIILQNLTDKLKYFNSLVEQSLAITLDVYDVTNCTVFPDALITELTRNPVSNTETFQKSNKTLFYLVDEVHSQFILDLFSSSTYNLYDNIFILGPGYSYTGYYASGLFHYAFIPVNTFSFNGYKLSAFVDPLQEISPYILKTYDIITLVQNIYKASKNDVSKFISELKSLNYLNNHNWFEYTIVTYELNYHPIYHLNPFIQNPFLKTLCFYQYQFNPLSTGSIISNNPLMKVKDDSNDPNAINPKKFLEYQADFISGITDTTTVIAGQTCPIDVNTILNTLNNIIMIDNSVASEFMSVLDSSTDHNFSHTPLYFSLYYADKRPYDLVIATENEPTFEIIAYYPPNQSGNTSNKKYVVWDTPYTLNGHLNTTYSYNYSHYDRMGNIINTLSDTVLLNTVVQPDQQDTTPSPDSTSKYIVYYFNKGNLVYDNLIYNSNQRSTLIIKINFITTPIYYNYQVNDIINVVQSNIQGYNNSYAIIRGFNYNPFRIQLEYLNWDDINRKFKYSGVKDNINQNKLDINNDNIIYPGEDISQYIET